MSASQLYEENVCMEEDCKSEVTVQCRSHNLNICATIIFNNIIEYRYENDEYIRLW